MAIDSLEELRKFQWSNPLRHLCDQCIEKDSKRFLNAVIGYDTYFEYLVLIWARYVEDFGQYDANRLTLDKLIGKFTGARDLSPKEIGLYQEQRILLIKLRLDYESFVIFAAVFMNKLARLAELLIGVGKSHLHESFSNHKKYLKVANIPKVDYAELVRERTDWFDNFLKPSRDKIMIHGDLPWTGVRHSPTRGIHLTRDRMLNGSDLRKETEMMISLKNKYAEKYPQLKGVGDLLWGLTEFFMSHNIKLEPKDRESFYWVLLKVGSTLPSLHYLATCIHNFKEFSKVFNKSF